MKYLKLIILLKVSKNDILKDLVMILGEHFYSRRRSTLVASCHVGRVGGGRRGGGGLRAGEARKGL